MTILYLLRHSEPFKVHKGIVDVKDDFLITNMCTPLSIYGEKLAEKISMDKEFDNLSSVWSSNYARAMSTAKYFAYRNDLKVNISDKLGERVHGVRKVEDIPENFELKQLRENDYKIESGESQNDTRERMYSTIMKLVEDNKNKKIAVVSHATAISFFLKKWCDIEILEDRLRYSYKDKVLLEGYLRYCQTFKLEFDDNNELIDINVISFDN